MNDTGTLTLTDFLLGRIADDEDFAWADLRDYGPEGDDPTNLMAPSRWLAECEAKRRIVQEHEWSYRDVAESGLKSALRILASVYADHPDYREEWKVS